MHFFSKGVEGDCEILKYLEDPALMPVQAETRRQHGGESVCQSGGFCITLWNRDINVY
jgi:hypothetical protein